MRGTDNQPQRVRIRGIFRISAGTDTFLIRSNKILLITLFLYSYHQGDIRFRYSKSHLRYRV